MPPLPPSPREQAEEALAKLGFNRSCARLYLSLLELNPATGYELAARSGVPRAAIYNTLHAMEKDGLVSKIQENPARYEPLDPDRLATLLSSRFELSLTELKKGLSRMVRASDPSGTWNVIGYDNLLEQARLLIREAETRLSLSLWQREADALAEELRKAVARGVDVILFSFNPLPEGCGLVHSYHIRETELETHWPHKIIVVSDNRSVLMGNASRDPDNRAVLTQEKALVEMAVSNLVLDLTLWGQRHDRDPAAVIAKLTPLLAPVETLAHESSPLEPEEES